jgi:peptidoglycan/xylan/chitin deacetylase (PgdA/CDA1 family)
MAGVVLLAAVLVWVCGGPATAATSNLVTNASMESSAGSRPLAWSSIGSGANQRTFSYPSGGAAAGRRFVRVDVAKRTTGSAGWAFAPVRVTAGRTYVYRDSWRASGRHVVQAKLVSTSGATSYRVLGELGASSTWRQSTFTFIVPARTATVSVQHVLVSTGRLDVDAAQLAVRLVAATPAPTGTPTPKPTSPKPTPRPSVTAGRGLVSVTFDDGLRSQYDNAFPVLRNQKIPGTFYLISSLVNQSSSYMTTAQGKELQAAGGELGSHTVTHRNLTTLSADEVNAELGNSRRTLEGLFGPIRSLAYPYGATSASVEAQAATYYATARTTSGGVNVRSGYDPLALTMRYVMNTTDAATVASWLQGAATSGSWVILVYHGIDDTGGVYSTSPSMFAEHMAAVKASGLTPVTVTQGRALTS